MNHRKFKTEKAGRAVRFFWARLIQGGSVTGTTLSGRFLAVVAGGILLAGCGANEDESVTPTGPDPVLHTFQQGHMGTLMTIRIWAKESEDENAETAANTAFARIKHLESLFSDYDDQSEIVRLVRDHPIGVPVPISEELLDVLTRGEALSQETGGAFDVTIGPMVRLWRQARKNHRLPTDERIADARERTGREKIALDSGNQTATLQVERMQIDLGGIAKGYAADAAMKILREKGFPQSLVAASGDIVVGDPPPHRDFWRVGIRSLDVADTDSKSDLTGTVKLINAAISTSGDTEQAVNIGGVRYSHIVDSKTALGLTERIAVTVIGPDATTTDSLATAVSVLGWEMGLAFIESKEGVECLILKRDSTGQTAERRSSGFPEVGEVVPQP